MSHVAACADSVNGKKAMIGTLIEIATLRIDQLTDDKFESPSSPQ